MISNATGMLRNSVLSLNPGFSLKTVLRVKLIQNLKRYLTSRVSWQLTIELPEVVLRCPSCYLVQVECLGWFWVMANASIWDLPDMHPGHRLFINVRFWDLSRSKSHARYGVWSIRWIICWNLVNFMIISRQKKIGRSEGQVSTDLWELEITKVGF